MCYFRSSISPVIPLLRTLFDYLPPPVFCSKTPQYVRLEKASISGWALKMVRLPISAVFSISATSVRNVGLAHIYHSSQELTASKRLSACKFSYTS